MQGVGLPDNTLVIWIHPDVPRDSLLYLGQHQLMKDLQYPCTEAGERAVGLVLEAAAGVRSWESLFLGAELPQKLTASGVTVRGYLQCTACQGTSCARQCGQAQAVSSACWRLPDGTGDCKWLSDRAMEQMRGLQEWQQPITQLRCLRKLLLRAHDKGLRNGSVRPCERPLLHAGEVLSINGHIFCLGPGSEKMLAWLKTTYESQWYTDILVVHGHNGLNIGEKQARAEAALLPKYKMHVLLAQPNSQEDQPCKQPGMMLDGEMLATGIVNTLLDNASCVTPAAESPGSAAPPRQALGRSAAPERHAPPHATARQRQVPAHAAEQQRQAPAHTAAPPRQVPAHANAPPCHMPENAAAHQRQTLAHTAAPPRQAQADVSAPSRQVPAHASAPQRQLAAHAASTAQLAVLGRTVTKPAAPLQAKPASMVSGATMAGLTRLLASQTFQQQQPAASTHVGRTLPPSQYTAASRASEVDPQRSAVDSLMQPLQPASQPMRGLLNGMLERHELTALANSPGLASLHLSAAFFALAQLIMQQRRLEAAEQQPSSLGTMEQQEYEQQCLKDDRYSRMQQPRTSSADLRSSLVEISGRGQRGSTAGAEGIHGVQRLAAARPAALPPPVFQAHQAAPTQPRASRMQQPVSITEACRRERNAEQLGGRVTASSTDGSAVRRLAAAAPAARPERPAQVAAASAAPSEQTAQMPTSSDAGQDYMAAPQAAAQEASPEQRAREMAHTAWCLGVTESALMRHASQSDGPGEEHPADGRRRARRSISRAAAPPPRVSHAEMEAVVAESGWAKRLGVGVRGKGRGRGRPRRKRLLFGRPSSPDLPTAEERQQGTRRRRAEEDALVSPKYFPVKRARSRRPALPEDGVPTSSREPREALLADLPASGDRAPPASDDGGVAQQHKAPEPECQPEAAPSGDGAEMCPSAPGTPSSAAQAPLSLAAQRRAAEQSSTSLSPSGTSGGPADKPAANKPPPVAAAAAPEGASPAEVLAEGAGDLPKDPVPLEEASPDDAAPAATATGPACSVDVSLSGEQTGGQDLCAAVAEQGNSSAPGPEEGAAEKPRRGRKKRKALADAQVLSLSPPGAFGRAVFGRKRRGNEEVTYNEKKLRQQQWKANQVLLEGKRRRERERDGQMRSSAAHSCGDRTQLLMRLLPDGGLASDSPGFRLSALCEAVLADADDFLSMDMSSSQSRLLERAREGLPQISEAAQAAQSAHIERLDRLAAYLNSPSDRSPRKSVGHKRGRKPGRPRKTLRLSSPGREDSPALQTPGRKPAALPAAAAAAQDGHKRGPGRPPKSQQRMAKFADATALSDVEASVGTPQTAAFGGGSNRRSAGGRRGVDADTSSLQLSADLGRAGSGGVTSALNLVSDLCRDINPEDDYSSGAAAAVAAQEPPGRAKSRLHVVSMSALQPETALPQDQCVTAQQQHAMADDAAAKKAAEKPVSESAVNESAPAVLAVRRRSPELQQVPFVSSTQYHTVTEGAANAPATAPAAEQPAAKQQEGEAVDQQAQSQLSEPAVQPPMAAVQPLPQIASDATTLTSPSIGHTAAAREATAIAALVDNIERPFDPLRAPARPLKKRKAAEPRLPPQSHVRGRATPEKGPGAVAETANSDAKNGEEQKGCDQCEASFDVDQSTGVGPSRTGANDWRLMKPRKTATWDRIFSRSG